MKNEELVEWANNINTVPENYQGIIFSDEMNDKLQKLDDEVRGVDDPDREMDVYILYWKTNRSTEALVKIMALGYRYLIGVMLHRRDEWSHLTPDEALMAGFKALPYSLDRYTIGRSKFLSWWSTGMAMAWNKLKEAE